MMDLHLWLASLELSTADEYPALATKKVKIKPLLQNDKLSNPLLTALPSRHQGVFLLTALRSSSEYDVEDHATAHIRMDDKADLRGTRGGCGPTPWDSRFF